MASETPAEARTRGKPVLAEVNTQLRAALLNPDTLIGAEFRRGHAGDEPVWETVSIRPVQIKDDILLQFSYFDGRQVIARNLSFDEAAGAVDDLLTAGFRSIIVNETTGSWRVQVSKKGRPIIHKDSQAAIVPLSLAHDRDKPYLLDATDPPPFLKAIGVATQDGRIRSGQQRKFRQINEFLRLLAGTNIADELPERPLRLVDLGCGNAALTFAAYHYLHHMAGLPVRVEGVDIKPHLIEKHNETARSLGWDDVRFTAGQIVEYQPVVKPDVVIALHACDTATDEALAQGVWAESKLILSAPCCHHHLQAQLAEAETPPAFEPVMRHGILRERLGDTLTDAFRAQILTILGYRTDVIEFIALSHTPKNLLIRAVRQEEQEPATTTAAVASYLAMKAQWSVTPYLEALLSDRLEPLLAKQ